MQGFGNFSRLSQATKKQETQDNEGTIHSFFLKAYIQKPNRLDNISATRNLSACPDQSRGQRTGLAPYPVGGYYGFCWGLVED